MVDQAVIYEDMLFFERRLTEVISHMEPKSKKWRIALGISFLFTIYGAYFWIFDPEIRTVSLRESLMKHPFFSISFIVLISLFLIFGVHKRIVSAKIIALRCRTVLSDFCLSCDEKGKLVVRPTPGSSPSSGGLAKPLNIFDNQMTPFFRRTIRWTDRKGGAANARVVNNATLQQNSSPISQVSPEEEEFFQKQCRPSAGDGANFSGSSSLSSSCSNISGGSFFLDNELLMLGGRLNEDLSELIRQRQHHEEKR